LSGSRVPLFTAPAAMTELTYDDPHTALHPKKPIDALLKKLILREKKLPKSQVPLTQRNLEEFFNPDFNPNITGTEKSDAFLAIRAKREVSVLEWLQLLP
jgi:hypothetical protein